jgi:formylglycine-generating enzyme required for sulfatase activity
MARALHSRWILLVALAASPIPTEYPAVPNSDGHVVIEAGGLEGVRTGMEAVLVRDEGDAQEGRVRVIRVRDRESVAELVSPGAVAGADGPMMVRFPGPLPVSAKIVIGSRALPVDVWVDGLSLGNVQEAYLTAGRHKIRLVKTGHKPWGTRITLAPGETREIEPTFPANPRERALVLIRGGTVVMGSERGDRDERPSRTVLVSPFYIRSCEVTRAEYSEFDPSYGHRFPGEPDHPAGNLNWWDAVGFCNWLSRREGLPTFYQRDDLRNRADVVRMDWASTGYRLPTEAEWELACRGGAATAYPWGRTMDDRYCWHVSNAGGGVHLVATRRSSGFGLFDMIGNVAEWCNDWYDPAYYGSAPRQDPTGPETGTHRVIRGGSWRFGPDGCRCAGRFFLRPRHKFDDLGFRPVRPYR